MTLLVALIWTFMLSFDLWLMFELFVKAPREIKQYELGLAWREHFLTEVPSKWTFYDGLGG